MFTLGSSIVGSQCPAEGRIRDLDILPIHDGIDAVYTHESNSTNVHALTYLNGTISAIDTDGVTNLSRLKDGFHNINIIPQLESDPVPAIRFDESDGQHVLLTWAAHPDNITGYRIYQTDLAGDNSEHIATVTARRLEPALLKYPTTGTGSGRITADATPLPPQAYGSLTITITDEGAFDYTIGSESGSATFYKGQMVYLSYGVGILFTDDPAEYETGDAFTLAAGPETRWLSDPLPAGEYRYAISAFNDLGDESTLTLTQVYEIVQLADPVTEIIESWSDTTLTIAFTLPDNAVSVNLYSNFEQQESEFLTYTTLSPQANHTSTFTIDFGSQTGTFKYYLRPVTADGVELEDYTLHFIQIPATNAGVVLGTPENLLGERVGVHNWSVSWTYLFQANDDLDHFTIWRDGVSVATILTTPDAEGIEETFTYTETTESTPAGELEIYITAHTSGAEFTTSDTITITTVASAPVSAPTGINGGAA